MKNLMQIWLYQNITPTGQVYIVKSLILSKIIHILQSLPAPVKEYFRKIEKKFLDLIWKGKRHEVSKSTLCLNTEEGGLNMINLTEFDQSLKLTWIRKTINSNADWLNFAKFYKTEHLLMTDVNHHKLQINGIDNLFWKDVATSYSNWYIKL